MDFPDIFKSLAIDTWYKALMCLGGIVFVLSIFLPTHGVPLPALQLMSLGAFLIGLGEWKNHKPYTMIKRANAYTGPAAALSGIVRQPDFIGCLFLYGGTALVILGVWKAFRG